MKRKRSMQAVVMLVLAGATLTACIDLAFKAADWTVEGVKRVGPKALWHEKAAAGDPEAQYFYGKTFCCGKRPLYDNHEALYWFCKAARVRHRDALYEIGHLYEHAPDYEGFLLPKDDVLAYVYYRHAASYGHSEAEARARHLAREQTPMQRVDSETLMKAFPNIPCGVDMDQYVPKPPATAAEGRQPILEKRKR